MTVDELLGLFADPAGSARRADSVRRQLLGPQVTVRAAPEHPAPQHAALLRRGDISPCDQWPEAGTLREHDRVVVVVPASADGRRAFAEYLLRVVAAPACSIAPISASPAGLHTLWCIAAARVALPAHIRVEARHDLLGPHLAQVAVGFGADTLAGPVAPSRHLPLAGTTRPTESSHEGLFTLVRQAGLEPIDLVDTP